MQRQRSTGRVARFALIVVSVALLAGIAPVTAAPSAAPGTSGQLADHVTDCNVSFDAGGNVLLDGSALTLAEAALLDALLLTDASLAAALEAASDVDADACVNLDIDVLAATIALNADIAACGAVTAAAGTITVGDVEIGADLLSTELSDVLTAAALADVDACAIVTITDNEVVVDAIATICAQATLLDTGVLSVVIGSEEFFLDGTLVDASGLLEVGVTAEVNLAITATLDVAADTVDLTIVASACAAGGGATPAPSVPGASPPGGGATLPPGASPIPGLPDTGTVSAGSGIAAAVLGAAFLVALTMLIRIRRSLSA